MITKRIFMAEADAGGASAAPAPAPAETTDVAPGATGSAPVFSKEMADAVASAVAKEVAGIKDSIFAEARRTFTEKRNKPKDEPTAQPQSPSQGLDPAAERRVLRDFDRSMAKHGLSEKISTAQWSRAEKALLDERPDDVAAWVKDYFDGYGLAPAATPAPAPQQAAAPQKPTNDRPVSDRGAPPVSKTPLEETPLRNLAPDDLKALINKIGASEYRKKLFAELKGTTVQVKP